MGIVIELTGTEWARVCLEAARAAKTEMEAAELLERHRRLMRKRVTTDAGPFFSRAGRLAVQGRRSRGTA